MKTPIWFIVILITVFPAFLYGENRGSVCLGPFLSVVWYAPSDRPYLTIGDYGPFHFNQENQSTQLVINDLDLKKVYKVKVHFDGKVIQSWDLDFAKIGSDRVCIWRDKGAWRMEPLNKSKCE